MYECVYIYIYACILFDFPFSPATGKDAALVGAAQVKGVVATGVIMELEVFVGKLCIVDRQGHTFQRRWREEFDTAWVPATPSRGPKHTF